MDGPSDGAAAGPRWTLNAGSASRRSFPPSSKEGDLDEAGRNFDRACTISRLQTAGRPRELAECYNNLGALAERREKYARARVFLSVAFRYFRLTAGEEHPDTMHVCANLAAIVKELGDSAGAEALFQKIADVRRRLLQPNHPDLAQALLDLAIAQRSCRHVSAAQATLNELLQMRRSYRFPRDQSEAETWNLQCLRVLRFRDCAGRRPASQLALSRPSSPAAGPGAGGRLLGAELSLRAPASVVCVSTNGW